MFCRIFSFNRSLYALKNMEVDLLPILALIIRRRQIILHVYLPTRPHLPAYIKTCCTTHWSSSDWKKFPTFKIYSNADYISFDYLKQVEEAKESPEYFLSRLNTQTILDEIKYVPELFRELKIKIDNDRIIKLKDYSCVNPLNTSYELTFVD